MTSGSPDINRNVIFWHVRIPISPIFFLNKPGKYNFYVFSFLYHDCLHINCLNYIFDEFLEEKNEFWFFFVKFYTVIAYIIDPVVRKKRKNSLLSFLSSGPVLISPNVPISPYYAGVWGFYFYFFRWFLPGIIDTNRDGSAVWCIS